MAFGVCDGIEYFLDGERRTAYFSAPNAELPIRHRNRAITFYRWGVLSAVYFESGNTPGWGAKFPETGWAPLEDIRAGKWNWLEPKPVRIFAARFVKVNAWLLDCWFPLKPGEFIQGLLAYIGPHHRRVYVVTVPAPPSYADQWDDWPRIVSAPKV